MRWPIPLLLLAIAVSLAGGDALAQCGATVSQCRQCHEINKQHPVLADGRPWHKDHAFGDFCVACHGGDGTATESAAAHDGLMDPLRGFRITCGTAMCHGGKAEQLAAGYRSALQPAAPLATAPTPADAHAPAPTAPSAPDANAAAAAVALGLALVGGASVVWNERRRRASGGPS